MINRVILLGRLTKDLDLRYTPSGVAVATFTLAVNRRFSNSQGDREADFIDIVVWRQLAELCANYIKKGSQIALEGRLQTRSYENKERQKVYVTEVVADNVQFLHTPGRGEQSAQPNSHNSNPRSSYGSSFPTPPPEKGRDRNNKSEERFPWDEPSSQSKLGISDDDLPF